MNIDGVVVDDDISVLYFVEDFFFGKDFVWFGNEQEKEFEFFFGQFDNFFFFGDGDLVLVNDEVVYGEGVWFFLFFFLVFGVFQ